MMKHLKGEHKYKNVYLFFTYFTSFKNFAKMENLEPELYTIKQFVWNNANCEKRYINKELYYK